MLTKKQHSAAARVLFEAYCRYRRTNIRAIAQERWIQIHYSSETKLEGVIGSPRFRLATVTELKQKNRSPELSPEGMQENPRILLLPHFQAPEKAIEFIFAHELAHDVLTYAGIKVEEPLFTRKPEERAYTDAEWEFEYLCDTFAFYFVMYRAGIELLHPLQEDSEKAFWFDPLVLKQAQANDSWLPIHTCWISAIQVHAKNMPAKDRIGMQTLARMMLDF